MTKKQLFYAMYLAESAKGLPTCIGNDPAKNMMAIAKDCYDLAEEINMRIDLSTDYGEFVAVMAIGRAVLIGDCSNPDELLLVAREAWLDFGKQAICQEI